VADPSATVDDRDEDGRVRIARRDFIGAGLAGAGAALIPATAAPKDARATESSSPSASAGGDGGIGQLPLRGLYPNLPAVPVDAAGSLETLARLALRDAQETQAKQGLTQKFTINGTTRPAYEFLFGEATARLQSDAWKAFENSLRDNPEQTTTSIQQNLDRRSDAAPPGATDPLSLEQPEQFSISWTTIPNVYKDGSPSLSEWALSLTDADSATKQFWPTIAEHGFGYNLILPEKVGGARARALRREFGTALPRQLRRSSAGGDLYVIDMSRFEALQTQTVNGAPRFTPSTITLLTWNPRTKTLTPIAIIVSGQNGRGRTRFTRSNSSDDAWLYALQAAKASITLYGVWIGHVYHWHLVTAAMQMTMFNTLPSGHPIRQLLAPQSKYAIPFDDVLLGLWPEIAPPTSLTSATEFLALMNDFAAERSYFDDDPKTTIDQLELRQSDFTAMTPWDRYPVVQQLLKIWNLVEPYVDKFVDTTYASDAAVAADHDLQTWIATASSTDASTGGNIRGLPAMTSRAALGRVLTSLLYRITVHGISRLSSTSNPALTFVANFPHCLQRTDIPNQGARMSTKDLLSYLPNTQTISEAVTFYFTFTFSTPYEPFIPLDGIGKQLFFPGDDSDARNQALIDLRRGLAAFIEDYQPDMPQRYQWPLNIET
jgi:hypothetical protein